MHEGAHPHFVMAAKAAISARFSLFEARRELNAWSGGRIVVDVAGVAACRGWPPSRP